MSNLPTSSPPTMSTQKNLQAAALLACIALSTAAKAQSTAPADSWQAGLVLDVSATSRALELGARDKGLGLGHSDLLVRGALNQHLSAEATVGFHTEDKKLQKHVEGAWLQTRSLPAGLQLRAGRFSSQIGYLNEVHPHADDYTERPLLYRGLLGGHWYDDGVRLNWTAPTPFYLRVGAELFTGKKLVPHSTSDSKSRATTLSMKVGNDISASSSWQWGLSQVNNRREAEVPTHEAEATGHDHSHAAGFTGKRMWVSDLVWKWSPSGNNRNQQVRINWEYAQVGSINRYATSSMRHRASSLGATWKFSPSWEVGLRSDWLRVHQAESDEGEVLFAAGRLKENALMLAYKPTHMQTLRLQVTQQRGRGANDEGEPIFANPARRSIQLQYVIGFGAHGAHAY